MNLSPWVAPSLRANLSRYWIHTLGTTFLLFILFSVVTRNASDTNAYRWHNKIHHGSRHHVLLSQARRDSLDSISNSTLGFQKILALNLPERTDHRDGLVLAAALSNFSVEFVDGVRGDSIIEKALPPGPESVRQHPGALGAWRAHMNALSQIVSSGWGSALIFEDDIDWDVRLRSQLHDIALGADFVMSNPDRHGTTNVEDVRHSHVPRDSPYGDDWDVMWLGHCGMELVENTTVMLFEDDASVPERDGIISWNGQEAEVLSVFAPHTRIVTEQKGGTCSLAYAVSQRGARGLLYELGVRQLDSAFDLMLRDFCQGENGRGRHRCVAVLPQVFDHYRQAGPVSGDSDVGGDDQSNEIRTEGMSYTIRWSTRLNTEKLLNGETDYLDQYPTA